MSNLCEICQLDKPQISTRMVCDDCARKRSADTKADLEIIRGRLLALLCPPLLPADVRDLLSAAEWEVHAAIRQLDNAPHGAGEVKQ